MVAAEVADHPFDSALLVGAFDIGGMTSTFHQEHADVALARAAAPPKLINITRPWFWAPPKPIDR